MFKEQLSLPTSITYTDGEKPNEKVLTIEPFYKGYGTTVGNALRRALLSSLTGAAITHVKIKGADHEFSALEGVKEDVVDIILNLKNIRFKVHSEEPVVLTLKVSGEKKVTAKDFDKNADAEVANPAAPVASLSSKSASLEMEVTVQKGRGYMPVEAREEEDKEIGTIAIDAMYSPIKNVSLEVTQARVGQDINYDKLIMGIETDGTITAEEAVERSAALLVEHFSIFGDNPVTELQAAAEEAQAEEEVSEDKK